MPGAAPVRAMHRHVEHVMGTAVSFALSAGELAVDETEAAVAAACADLRAVDERFSTWKAASELSQLRRGEIRVEQVSGEMHEIIDRCVHALKVSGGYFDAWSQPGGFDPTGIVKGWAGDRALAMLRAAGVPGAMVNAGGDIAAYGTTPEGAPWRIGVRDPFAIDQMRAVVEIDGAVATSGDYERGEHINNPRARATQVTDTTPTKLASATQVTGAMPTKLASATVTGPELALADAMATAVFAGGASMLARIEALEGHEAFVIDVHGMGYATPGFRFAPTAR